MIVWLRLWGLSSKENVDLDPPAGSGCGYWWQMITWIFMTCCKYFSS